VAGFCEHGDGTFQFHNNRAFLEQLSNSQLL